MKIKLFKDRTIEKCGEIGTQNENNVTEIELIVPDKYQDYNKKIVFDTEDGIVWDIIEDNHYKIRKNIAKYKSVSFYIWLTKDDEDFRSETKKLFFNSNQDASGEITEEEIGKVNKVIQILEDEIKKVEDLQDAIEDMSTAIQFANFEVTDNMELVINTAERLKNTNFSLNEETGNLEVEIYG